VQDGVNTRSVSCGRKPRPGKLNLELLEALRGIKAVRQFPKGALLFEQGFPVTGIYLVESGEVRILLPTGNRQNQLLEVAGPGTILGLSESISGENYKVTAEAGDQTSAAFIPRRGFLEWDRFCFCFSWDLLPETCFSQFVLKLTVICVLISTGSPSR
jgi:CRP-like cAMP-binding protein